MVSDGSKKDSLLTFGAVFREKRKAKEIAGIIPSHPNEVSSYRAELGGLLKSYEIIRQMEDEGARWKQIKVWADNNQAIAKAPNRWIASNASNVDFRCRLLSIIRHIKSPISFQWVEGHQDSTKVSTVLSFESTLNIQADLLAKRAWKQAQESGILVVLPTSPKMLLSASFQGALLTNLKRQSLHLKMSEQCSLAYWRERLQWTQATADMVWWDGLERGAKGQRRSVTIGMIKLATGHVPVAHKL